MSDTTADKRMAALRADDGPIAVALAEVNTRLTAWLEAMSAGQTVLSSESAQRAPVAEGGPESQRSSAPDSASEQPAADTRACVAQTQQNPASRGPNPRSKRRSKLFKQQTVKVAASKTEPRPVDPSATGSDHEATGEDQDEEALLASLDAKTAEAIRVKRRLASNKRSVRDLLAELQSGQASAKGLGSGRTGRWR